VKNRSIPELPLWGKKLDLTKEQKNGILVNGREKNPLKKGTELSENGRGETAGLKPKEKTQVGGG